MRVRLTRYAAALTVSLAGFALIAGGCGGGDEDEAREVVDSFVEAAGNEDAGAVCDLWSEWTARDALILFGAADRLPNACEEIRAQPAETMANVFASGVESDAEVEEVDATEDAFTYEVEGLTGEIEVRRFDGEWRLNSVCVPRQCQPSTEDPLNAPIGG